jgi:hypothetical protein
MYRVVLSFKCDFEVQKFEIRKGWILGSNRRFPRTVFLSRFGGTRFYRFFSTHAEDRNYGVDMFQSYVSYVPQFL